MSDAPETIWIDALGVPQSDKYAGTYYLTDDEEHLTFQYRRADLPATDEQAMQNEKVKALRMALRECILEMGVCRVFVNSRQKTKQPEGADIYEEVLDEARAALAAIDKAKETK